MTALMIHNQLIVIIHIRCIPGACCVANTAQWVNGQRESRKTSSVVDSQDPLGVCLKHIWPPFSLPSSVLGTFLISSVSIKPPLRCFTYSCGKWLHGVFEWNAKSPTYHTKYSISNRWNCEITFSSWLLIIKKSCTDLIFALVVWVVSAGT